MNALDTYLKKLDNSDFDILNEEGINKGFQEVIVKLNSDGDNDSAHFADIDRQAFALNKSFEVEYKDGKPTKNIKGISWKMSGTRTFEDGREEPFYWPDIKDFKQSDFEYLARRYKKTKNLYAKTEYGLILYFNPPNQTFKHNIFKNYLVDNLFTLGKSYLNEIEKDNEDNYYILYYLNVFKAAIYIAKKIGNRDKVKKILSFLSSKFITRNLSHNYILRLTLDFIDIVSSNYADYKEFEGSIDVKHLCAKSNEIANNIEKSNLWGAVSLADACLRLEQKSRKKSLIEFAKYKAQLYEKLAQDAIDIQNFNAVPSFIQNAMEIYRSLKDDINCKRIENWYKEVRNQVQMSIFKQELSKEYTDYINNVLEETIKENDTFGILDTIAIGPMFGTINSIHKLTESFKSTAILTSMIPLTIIDKYGNKIQTYNPGEPKDGYDSNFWQTYYYNYQIGVQALQKLVLKSIQDEKLKYLDVKKYLLQRWYGDRLKRHYVNEIIDIRPIEIILPSIHILFNEMKRVLEGKKPSTELILCIDSLSLKIEYLIRLMFEILGIPTFKNKRQQVGNTNIVIEKSLDELLARFKVDESPEPYHILREEDRIFIKLVLIEKVGDNIRNRVAHGLMDKWEYNLNDAIILFSIILRLGSYKFENKKK